MIALVTGANRGIGREVCKQLAKAGCRTILSARNGEKAEASARSLVAEGLDVSAQTLDVCDQDSIRAAARDLASRFGRVDILVNNAAVLLAGSDDLLDTSIDDFRRTFETNVFGAIAVTQAFAPGMVERGYGRIVNVSSTAGQLTRMGTYAPRTRFRKRR